MIRRSLARLALALCAAGACGGAAAQADKPISLVVGYAAGGSADFVARVVGAELARRLGRQVIVENVAGASGMLAVQKVLAAPPDGGLIYMGGTDTVLVPMVNPKVRLDWDKDLQPIGRMTTVPMVFAVPGSAPYATLQDLVAASRKAPQGITYAIPGIGTMQHLYGALVAHQYKARLTHIPYRGGAAITNDLVGGTVDAAVLVLSTAMPFIKDRRIKALSVSDVARVPQLPGVPRLGEEPGLDGVSLPLWQGLFVRSGTPAAAVAAYERALLEAMAQPEVKDKLAESGITAAPLGGAALRTFIAPQARLYKDIVSASHITQD